ncbi:MAG: NDP-sugar synthase, partial [Deltaproteobacteria bacterium]
KVPITESVPKPLLPIGRLPLVSYALKLLAFHGITDVLMNLHHLGDSIRDALGDGQKFGVRLRYSSEDEILGTGGGLKRVHEKLLCTTVVVNGDTLCDVDLFAALQAHRRSGALATMVLRPDDSAADYGQIEVDARDRIVRILGQGDTAAPTRSYMYTGVQIIEPRFLEYLPPAVHTCIIRQGYLKALQHQEILQGFISRDTWADAGTPERYLQVNLDALAQRLKMRYCDPLAGYAMEPRREVAEVVRLGQDTQLGSTTMLHPPVLLGDEVRVGERTVVGPGVILGDRVQVGKDAQLRATIVLEGARIDAGAQLDGMLVGKRASLALKAAPKS